MTYLDTHVVAWLAAGLGPARLQAAGRALIAGGGEVRISPMVRLELQYLHEIGRLGHPATDIYEQLAAEIGLRVCDAPSFAVVREAERQTWTRDPFDRLIVAQAAIHEAPLVTKDESIHAAYDRAVW